MMFKDITHMDLVEFIKKNWHDGAYTSDLKIYLSIGYSLRWNTYNNPPIVDLNDVAVKFKIDEEAKILLIDDVMAIKY